MPERPVTRMRRDDAVTRHRARGVAILALVIVAVGAFFGGRASVAKTPSPTAAGSAAPDALVRHTIVEVFAPWRLNGSVSAGVTVVKRLSGSCWTGSIAVDDRQVWRCMSSDGILDPCFAPGEVNPVELACDPEPWNGHVTLLRLTSALPMAAANPVNSSGPAVGWAIELSDGDRCFVSTGANADVDGVLLLYYCASGNSAGPLNRQSEPWTVDYYPTGSDVLKPADVRVAWAG